MGFKIYLLWLFVVIGRPQDMFQWLVPLRLALVLAAITILFAFFNPPRTDKFSFIKTIEAKKYLLFYIIMILGIPFAYHRRIAFEFTFLTYIINLLFFFISIWIIDSFEKLKSTIFTICISTLFYCFFVLKVGSVSQGRLYAGSMFDPNDIAYVLVSLFPLSFFFVFHDKSIFKKIVAYGCIISSLIIIPLTGSRGGLLSLILIILMFLISMKQIKISYKVTFLTVIVLIAFFNFDKINVNRFETLSNIGSDYNATDEFGRVEIWKKAIQLTFANPIFGVGVNCFPMALGQLREELSIIPMWQTVHNSYLLIVVETGVVGLLVFVSIIVGCIRNFSINKRLKINSSTIGEFVTMASLLQIAFLGHLLSAFFLSQGYSIVFTLFFTLSALTRQLSVYENIENPEFLSNRKMFKNVTTPIT